MDFFLNCLFVPELLLKSFKIVIGTFLGILGVELECILFPVVDEEECS